MGVEGWGNDGGCFNTKNGKRQKRGNRGFVVIGFAFIEVFLLSLLTVFFFFFFFFFCKLEIFRCAPVRPIHIPSFFSFPFVQILPLYPYLAKLAAKKKKKTKIDN